MKVNYREIQIEGPVLLLFGPLGSFFARFSNYLDKYGVPNYKILFPLYEFGFDIKKRIYFRENIDKFKPFLKDIIFKHNIRHIFMYGDFIIPHSIAISLGYELRKNGYRINTEVFELGYLRPNFITLEPNRVNYNSNLNKGLSFYQSLDYFKESPIFLNTYSFRWRKIWKFFTFIHHSFVTYKICNFEHKLQPRKIYLWFQLLSFISKFYYSIKEIPIKKYILSGQSYFLVILQVATDSQVNNGTLYSNIEEYIFDILKSFSESGLTYDKLIFKHHPRDRGYNNYSKFIRKSSSLLGISSRVFYFHDISLARIFRYSNCSGVIVINSSVGFQALYHSIPLKVLSRCCYNFEGLSHQGDLSSFWHNPTPVDILLFKRFYKHVLETTQINGNFDGYFPFSDVFKVKLDFNEITEAR